MADGLASCCFQEGAAASPISKNVDAGIETAVASPVRHMHRDVAALLLSAATTPRRRRRKMPAPPSEASGRARYACAFEEEAPAEEGFAPPRLVWVKVRGHPWWPGQVFGPSDASKLALRERRRRRRDAVLVACFGDSTFLWADAEDLLPLRDGFPRLAEIGGRGTTMELFPSAVECALDEVARRLDAGLSCGCCTASSIMEMPVLPNSGVRRGARGAAVDAAFARDAFRGEAFVGYVRALAVAPTAGADMLDLAVASAQLKAFSQWRRRGVAPPADGAMVVASRGRATTPRRRQRTRRGDRDEEAPPGEMAMSMSARAAAADAAFMREVFRGEAPEVYDDSTMAFTPATDSAFTRVVVHGEAPDEYASATSLTRPPAAFDLAVCTMAQRNAFNQWMGAPSGIITEYTGTMDDLTSGAMNAITPPPPVRRDTAKKTRSPGGDGDDADADPGNCRIVTTTSCISSMEDSGCENDGDDGSETGSEDFEVGSNWEWELGWKDHVILMQFLAIVLLVCQLMQ